MSSDELDRFMPAEETEASAALAWVSMVCAPIPFCWCTEDDWEVRMSSEELA